MTTDVKEYTVHDKLAHWAENTFYVQVYDNDGYRYELEPNESVSFASLRPAGSYRPSDAPLFIVPDIMSYSDYSGSLVNKANNAWIRESWLGENVREYTVFDAYDEPDLQTPHVHGVYGGHGSDAIAINVSEICDECAEELAQILSDLGNYPLVDEDLHSELELTAQNEAWESWANWDFARALSDVSGLDVGRDDTFDGPLWALFDAMMQNQNEYWFTEGIDATVDLDRLVGSEPPRQHDAWLALVQEARASTPTAAYVKELTLTSWARAGQ